MDVENNFHVEFLMERDDFAACRGIRNVILMSIPLWAGIIGLVRWMI